MLPGGDVVQRQLVVWIEPNVSNCKKHPELIATLTECEDIEFQMFDDTELAVFFLMTKSFSFVLVAVEASVATDFFQWQQIAQLQTTCCVTMSIFVFGAEYDESVFNQYLTYTQCQGDCSNLGSEDPIRCLTVSNDLDKFRFFCTRKDTLGFAIALIMLLVDIDAFGSMLFETVDSSHQKVYMSNRNEHFDFIGYMSSPNILQPKLFHHLRFARVIPLRKNDAQLVAMAIFGKTHNLTTKQIATLCRFYSTGCCVHRPTLIKYLVRLWSLETPPFYRLVNTALTECRMNDVHLIRYLIYDYFEMFIDKSLPSYTGTVYRGIQTSKETIPTYSKLVGQIIYFVCFTSTSKSRARACLGGNVLFEIKTLSKYEQDFTRFSSNIDISSVSQFSEEEEVLYAPLVTFRLKSVVYNDNTDQHIIELDEINDNSFLSTLLLDKTRRFPQGTPFRQNTDMWVVNNVLKDPQQSARKYSEETITDNISGKYTIPSEFEQSQIV